MSVLKITANNFEKEVLNSNKTIIVDFYADWCSPCKMMSPIIDNIAEETDNINVAKLNVDEEEKIATQYNIMSIPTILIFKEGKEIKRFVGVTSKETILNEIKVYIMWKGN